MTAVWAWLNANVVGNLAAGFIQMALVAVPVWFKHIKPHLDAQAQHRRDVEDWFAGLHTRLDAAGVPDLGQPAESGAHGYTDTFTAVTP